MPNGGAVSWTTSSRVYRVDAETYMLCVIAANIEKDWNPSANRAGRFGMEAGHGKELSTLSERNLQLAVQGPSAMKIVQKINATSRSRRWSITPSKDEGRRLRRHSRSRAIRDRAVRIYAANEDGDKLWKRSGRPAKSSDSRISVWRARYAASGEGLLPLRQRHRRHHLADRRRTGLITKFAEGKGSSTAPAGEAEGRGRDPQAGGIQDDRPRHSAPRLRDRCARRHARIAPCHFGMMSPCMKVGFDWAT